MENGAHTGAGRPWFSACGSNPDPPGPLQMVLPAGHPCPEASWPACSSRAREERGSGVTVRGDSETRLGLPPPHSAGRRRGARADEPREPVQGRPYVGRPQPRPEERSRLRSPCPEVGGRGG